MRTFRRCSAAFCLKVEGGRDRGRTRRIRRHGRDPQACENSRRKSARPVARRYAAAGTAAEAISKDFTPLTDLRASASYRSRVAGNLVIKAIAEMAGIGAGVTRIADHRTFADAAE